MRRAVFLDRDGVINRKPPEGSYVRTWSEFEFLPDAVEGLAALTADGANLFLVTNQRGVARGIVDANELAEINSRMVEALASAGVRMSGVYVCPHDEGECQCRKPGIELFLRAKREHPWISFPSSDLVGDSLSDLEAGHRLDMRLWLVGEDERAAAVEREAGARGYLLAGRGSSLLELVRIGGLVGSPVGRD
jgi:histidinol-phosphate phosphatase family protein